MPKSKRNKVVSLTATRKKGVELKRKVMDEVKDCVDNYARVFLFSVKNMRNCKLKDVREEWRHSRFFFGKNKVIISAFGRSPQDEYKQNLHLLSERICGQKGLLFTNSTKEEVLKYFNSLSSPDFARTDDEATRNVVLDEGPLEQFEASLEPYLRQLGLATTLKKGVIYLTKEHVVCSVGEKLTSEKARLLVKKSFIVD
ncbi:hypothetical protein B4U80_08536 [Leptotrombidium deliense]|uniref:Ribosome assembly factor mrt4 n=1 Tax=Leptotrombidium deliense TaxID=299467 RepID=A0A443SVS3_9ACAR|nr:hypothetical protein B4U80_08536 [Leptotrombidium deliense]